MKTLEEITEAMDVLGWISNQVEERSGVGRQAMEMLLSLQLAQSYLTEYALLLSRGESHDIALNAAIQGKTDVSEHIENRRKSLN